MSVFYLDTSAALKLLKNEANSLPFTEFYDGHTGDIWISSALLRVEMLRSVRRSLPAAVPDARDLLEAFDYLAVHDEVIETAMAEFEPTLRSLDAIHLATARTLGADLDALVTYDDRLADAAGGVGIAVLSPRD